MTTKLFSATNLPHPRHSLEVGRFNISSGEQQYQHQHKRQKVIEDNTTTRKTHAKVGANDDHDDDDDASSNVNLPSTCLPRFSQLAQVIEVKKPGYTLPNRVGSNIKDFLGSYCVIETARPELFIRRDFISKFVDKGTIFVAPLSDHDGAAAATTTNYAPTPTAQATAPSTTAACGYSLNTTKNNVIIITMNSKQYHRFGLLATKVISPLEPSRRRAKSNSKGASDKLYRIEIDLKDERIMKSNKYQDKLMHTLRRLDSINKIYFRFIPDKSKLDLSLAAAQELSLEYFNHVIDEYNLDCCKPVPLTKCSIAQQKISRNWVNYSQLHPSFELSKLIAGNGGEMGLFQSELDRGRNDEKFDEILNGVVDVIDWLGFQLLALDCDKLAEFCNWNESSATMRRYDVSCTQLIGTIDHEHVQEKLDKLFVVEDGTDWGDSDVKLRALILYDYNHDKKLLMFHDADSGSQQHSAESFDDNTAKEAYQMSFIHDRTPVASDEEENAKDNYRSEFNRCVVYLQDCSNGPKAAREITVIGLSNLGI